MRNHKSHAEAAESYLDDAADGLERVADDPRAAAILYALLGVGHAVMHVADKLYMLSLPEDQRG